MARQTSPLPKERLETLDSHFKCDTEVDGECLDWGFVGEAFSGR
jgi:hypothetical protein